MLFRDLHIGKFFAAAILFSSDGVLSYTYVEFRRPRHTQLSLQFSPFLDFVLGAFPFESLEAEAAECPYRGMLLFLLFFATNFLLPLACILVALTDVITYWTEWL